MIADFLAHSTFMMDERAFATGMPEGPLPSAMAVGRKESGVTHLRFKPGGLAELKSVSHSRNSVCNCGFYRAAICGREPVIRIRVLHTP